MKPFRSAIEFLGLCLCALHLVAAAPANVPTATLDLSRTAPVTGFINVAVGSLRAVPIALDPNAVGLMFYALPGVGEVGSDTYCSTRAIDVASAPGLDYHGVICNASINVGGVTTTQRVPFALLRTATCQRSVANCDLADRNPAKKLASGIYGVLGIGLGKDAGAVNPFRMMGGPQPDTFTITYTQSSGRVQFGVEPSPRAALYQQVSDGRGSLGLAGWRAGTTMPDLSPAATVGRAVTFDGARGIIAIGP